MLLKTITKNAFFVISTCLAVSMLSSCSIISFGGSEGAPVDEAASPFEKPEVIAQISSPEIDESSGVAVSKCQKDVFWTHNDSGGGPFLYAFDSSGKSLGTWRLNGVRNIDWEDMATVKAGDGNCYLYIGDIGDNQNRREVHAVYRVAEPKLTGETLSSTRKDPLLLTEFDTLKFRYTNGGHNAEAMMVHPGTKDIYIVTKNLNGPSEVFKLKPDFGSSEVQTAPPLATISLPAIPNGFVTGADISPDGTSVVLCDYFSGFELTLPSDASAFDDIWTQKLIAFDLGPRVVGESVAYADDQNTVYATTENAKPPLIRVIRKSKK